VDRPTGERGLIEFLKRRNRKRFVRVGGQKARVIGDVGMLHTTLDVTNIECAVGESAILDVDPVNVKGLPILYV
jgi:alanine racemase